jgi:drug/metabolite transporter (DMT)-like permease
VTAETSEPACSADHPTSAPITEAAAPTVSWLPGYLALSVIWGSSFLFIKVGVRELHPLYVTLGRVLFGVLAVGVVLAVTRTKLPRDPRVWAHLAVIGAVGVATPFTLFGFGEQRVSSVLAGIWNATTPLVALPMAVLVFRAEKATVRKVAGVALGFVGVLVVLGVWHGVGGSQLTGQLMCFGAAVCYGITIPYQRRFLAGRVAGGVAVPAGQLIMALLLLAIVTPLVAGPPPPLASLSLGVIASIAALGALGTGIAFVLHFRVIRVAGVSTSASVTFLLPVVASAIGVLALGEHLAWYQPVGAAIVLAGVAVSQGFVLPIRRRAPAV